MITNEVAFIAIAVSDKERARKFYQEILELKPTSTQMNGAWIEYDLGSTTIGVGCHPAWKPSRGPESSDCCYPDPESMPINPLWQISFPTKP